MRNIERIKEMSSAQLAEFLTEAGAKVPTEFCDVLCPVTKSCIDCEYVGDLGDKQAWKIWLESEYVREEKEDDQKPQEPETVQTDEQGDPKQGSKDEKDPQQDAGRNV